MTTGLKKTWNDFRQFFVAALGVLMAASFTIYFIMALIILTPVVFVSCLLITPFIYLFTKLKLPSFKWKPFWRNKRSNHRDESAVPVHISYRRIVYSYKNYRLE